MKKRIILIIIAAAAVFALAACGGNQEPSQISPGNPTPTPTTAPAQAGTQTGFAFAISGHTIHMDANMGDVLDMLGEPLGIFEAPSCAFDGIDRIFQFPTIQIHTYPLDDQDFVHTIMIRDDSVATVGGIFLGSSFDDLMAAYGDGYSQEAGMFTFTRGRTTLSFLVENDMVVSILYGLIMD